MSGVSQLPPDDEHILGVLRERKILSARAAADIAKDASQIRGRGVREILLERGLVGRHELKAIENEILEKRAEGFSGESSQVMTGVQHGPSTATKPEGAAKSGDGGAIAFGETVYNEGPVEVPPMAPQLPMGETARTILDGGLGARSLLGIDTNDPVHLRGVGNGDAVNAGDFRDARYVVGNEIGRGGMGLVVEAYDRELCRRTAIKVGRKQNQSADVVARFVEEAQATAQLEHPNIVPVHDIGVSPKGDVYYVMKLVRGRTLREILAAVKHKVGGAPREFGRVRLLSIFQQVCMGLDYAHAKGVVHRDLKPDNIMIGDYGEVLVMDWGLAKVLGREFGPDAVTQVQTPRSRVLSRGHSQTGSISGTPLYMSPEQARGDIAAIDERSDIYALGAILYEILTYTPPFSGEEIGDLLDQVMSARVEPPSERVATSGAEPIPVDLDAVCMRALEKDKSKRFSRAREMYDEITVFLEGTRVKERNRREAEARVRLGQRASRRYFELRKVEARLRDRAEKISAAIPQSAPVDAKRPLWRTADLATNAERRAANYLSSALDQFTQALGFEPANDAARLGSAALYWDRFLAAEKASDQTQAIYYESLVRHFGGDEFAERLRGTASLAIETWPVVARVTIAPFVERDRRLVPGDAQEIGVTPLSPMPIEMGRYLVGLHGANGSMVRFPVDVGRLEKIRARVRIPKPGELAPGFVFIPEGTFLSGGDPLAFNSAPLGVACVGDFAISKFPVTCAEYLAFMNDLVGRDPALAEKHVPRVQPTAGFIWQRGSDGLYTLPEADPEGDRWLPNWPVIGISWEDAEAYAEWRSSRPDAGGRRFRLPTPDEWEKAGRGVDGRRFPWGNHFDPTFCHMSNTFPGRPQMLPVGTVETDESPYGVRDLAGCIREFCAGWQDEASGLRSLRGGYWGGSENIARLASRGYRRSYEIVMDVGFRLAHDLA
ncbi:MAG: SUMF1/EgtB/PvdO family nonheme iron enzyme [Deltaproteobacteria bacterium]|nr:SUMF1/EgtB/PvdO family nonheme iron enzyme [Deltaproteobacteria bacterium]